MDIRHLVFGLSRVLVVLATAFTLTANSEKEFGPVDPEELKMTREPLAPGAPAIILFRQVDRDDSLLLVREYNYLRIKILTEEGRKYADVEIPFEKESGWDIKGLKARMIQPDGTIVNYDGKVYEKSIVKAKGLKYMAKTFAMPDVRVGGIIEYAYWETFPGNYVYDSHWTLSNELFTKAARFSLKPDNDFACRCNWNWLPPGSAEPKWRPDRTIALEVNNIPAFPTEDFMPPPEYFMSRVDFRYSRSAFETDPDKFWKKKAKEWSQWDEEFVGRRKAMQDAVSRIVSPGDSPDLKLQKIYSRVQQMRNTSYEIRKTEQEKKREKRQENDNVEELWKRGYGNGLELTQLFLALARGAGLEAYAARVANRRNYFFHPKAMNSNELNCYIVLVKLDGKELYFDPGTAFTPFGMLPWWEAGVPGLRFGKDGGEWITTTPTNSTAARIERKANLRIGEAGDLEGELQVNFVGFEALNLRTEKRHDDESERKRYLEDLVKEQIPSTAEVRLTKAPDWSASSPDFVTAFDIKIPGWMSRAGRRAIFPTGIFTAAEKNVFSHTERVHPIYFAFPYSREDDITIALPPAWEVASLPSEQNHGGNPVLYSFKAEASGSSLRLSRKLSVNVVALESKYYPALRDFYQVVRTGDEQQALLQPNGGR